MTGTAVSLVPPPGFAEADRYPGFELSERAASIMVTELPGPAAALRKAMTVEELATRGMSLLESRRVTIDETEAVLLYVSQVAAGVEYRKWLLITGDAERSVVVAGAYPVAQEDLREPIRASVLSTLWKGAPRREASLFEGLPFRLTPTPALKVAGRVSNLLVMTESGDMAPSGGDQAVFGIGSSLGEVAVPDLEAFARARAEQSPHIDGLRDMTGEVLTIDGLPAYELVALGDDAKTGETVRLYQLLLVDGGTYYIAQGFVRSDRVPDFISEFRRVARSFRLHGRR